MPQQLLTRSGKLSDLARHVVLPSSIVSTGWPAVRDTCAGFGVEFDSWQDGAGRAILAKRADGSYAASIGGVVISIPRQVGKTFLIGAVGFALCLLHPGLTVIWTAHRLRTAAETFDSMQAFSQRAKIKPHVKNITLGAGNEAIQFHNGSRILFGARERGFGRGFANVGVLVFDEAQILTENAIDDMVPATNTADNPLLIFTGTPPKPNDPSEVFARKRAEAIAGSTDDGVYIEFSADPDPDPNDRKQWAKANPSFPRRTKPAAMLRMKGNLTLESFVREALGVWDEEDQSSSIDQAQWARLDHHEDDRPSPVALCIAVDDDREWSHICLAGRRRDGYAQVLVVQSAKGTAWVADRMAQLVKDHRPLRVMVNGAAPEGSLLTALAGAGVEVETVPAREVQQASAAFADAVAEGTLRHLNQGQLNLSVRVAGEQPQGAAWVWRSNEPGVDIAPLRGVTLALHALAKGGQITESFVPRRIR